MIKIYIGFSTKRKRYNIWDVEEGVIRESHMRKLIELKKW